ncbi:ferritin, heavy subunit-like [Sciurus carolinensis]|uniref:ferritin, heavy subunit-like n=1 Tax=Sciurus carolinensis TaxID=30640 RepID=UPI001FB4516A|nr:ferritin, heavy subunit-like [Sciurus carolinensis]
MERRRRTPISEECKYTINRLVAYQLHISDVYLSMACYFVDEKGMPPFVMFFEEEAEIRRQQAKYFLRFLRKREAMICLPVIKRPDIDNWGGAIQALTSALQMENILNGILEDLNTLASETGETELRPFLTEFLDKQKRNIDYLECQISYQNKLEEGKQMESMSEMSAKTSASGEET